jgi:hypothetical protein
LTWRLAGPGVGEGPGPGFGVGETHLMVGGDASGALHPCVPVQH